MIEKTEGDYCTLVSQQVVNQCRDPPYLAVDRTEGDLHDQCVDYTATDSDKVECVPGVLEEVLSLCVA